MKCSMGLWLLSVIIVLGIIAVTVQFMIGRVHVSPRLAEELFRNFTKKYNKSYDTPDEYQKRLNIFTVSICFSLQLSIEPFNSVVCHVKRGLCAYVFFLFLLLFHFSNHWKILFEKI